MQYKMNLKRRQISALAMRTALSAAVVMMGLVGGASTAVAQSTTYPTKPIRLVVPFPAGGATDIFARTLSQKLGEKLGTSVVVENKPGAGGTLGSDIVATMSEPNVPPAPGLFSTTTDVPNFSPNFCDKVRAKISVAPPAGKGTTKRMGLVG